MILKRKYFPCTFVLLALICGVVPTKSLQFNSDSDGNKMVGSIQKYFPHENNLCVVVEDNDEKVFLPTFQVPVVVFTQDQVLQVCGSKLTDQDGYVFVISNSRNFEEEIVPLLKCFNRTTLKLKTKYILVLDLSKFSHEDDYEEYIRFFQHLWIDFGIMNVAIIPVEDRGLNTDPPLLISYNPFLARLYSRSKALIRCSTSQNVRGIMTDRFRNMHGHSLKTAFFESPNKFFTLEDLNKKQTLGADPGLVFKHILEVSANVSFDVYLTSLYVNKIGNKTVPIALDEIIAGRADYCLNFFSLQGHIPGHEDVAEQLQILPNGYTYDMVFVVPKPRQIENWKFFEYIFQWQVGVGLGLVMVLFSGAALLFAHVHSNINASGRTSSGFSEVKSVWKAALSVSINRLPTTSSQRLVVACSSLFGLIFLTLCSAKLFVLVKSKPRFASIKSLQDLHDSGLPIYSSFKSFAPYLDEFENTSLHNLKDNFKTDPMYEDSYFFNAKYLNISDRALLYLTTLIQIISSLPQNKVYLQYFEVVQEPIFRVLAVMYLPFESVYFEHIKNLNLRMLSGGFFIKWYDAYMDLIVDQRAAPASTNASQGLQNQDGGPVPLTYDDLTMAFFILYIGLAASTLCFLVELCHRR